MNKQRRKLVKVAIQSPMLGLTCLVPSTAKANPLVWLWRLIFSYGSRRAAASTASRIILSNTTKRAFASDLTRKRVLNNLVSAYDLYTLADMLSVISAVSPETHTSILKYESEALWLDNVNNSFTLEISNFTNRSISTELILIFDNLENGSQFSLGKILIDNVPANSRNTFPADPDDSSLFIKPITKGTYLITPVSVDSGLVGESIGPITVVPPNKVQFRS